MMEINYEELGLRVGLEIHQQLDTASKLFCSCPTKLFEGSEEGVTRIERYLRIAKSETGEIDPAAIYEYMKGRKIIYLVPRGHVCNVELDEEPPHELNREALTVAIGIALGFKSKIVDEVHVMRKIVVDGSNTTGFQRTAIIALGGEVLDDEGVVRIQTICLEEDAARKVGEVDGAVVYNLDRLGIPLIEISTAPDIRSPEQALRVASKIGIMLRLTGKVKRGLGTIRQDLNISIKGGTKIEIKGVQRLELLPKIVEYEVMRQLKLLEIRDELIKRGVRKEDITSNIYDVTEVFRDTKSKLIRDKLRAGCKVYACVLKKFKGLLKVEVQPGRRFGTELADYAREWGGVSGIIHTDELPGYGISDAEVHNLFKFLNVDEGEDVIVITVGTEDRCTRALKAVIDRARDALSGIPKETRVANEDGTTKYMRPQPGAARMYPETDIPPITIDSRIINEALKYVPKDPNTVYEELISKYSLSPEISKQLIRSPYFIYFYDLVRELSDEELTPQYIASLLTIHLRSLKSEGVPTENISIEVIKDVLSTLKRGEISKDGVIQILKEYALDPRKPIEELIKKYSKVDVNEVIKIVSKIIESNREELIKRKDKAFNIVMGLAMKELRYRVDGRIVADVVRNLIRDLGQG
ncbi:MAG: Glu-tRNA(Gln) amidotransferase subunit GatE [Sulfolobales archaeon]